MPLDEDLVVSVGVWKVCTRGLVSIGYSDIQLHMSNHQGYAIMSILILIIINGNVCRIENLKTKIHQNRLLLKIT